jgi:diacylglycerol kinase family enzyme
MPQAAVVFNPVSGHVPAERRERTIRDAFSAAGVEPLWLETTRDDAGREAAERAVAAGAELVAVAGGDGTVRAAAAGLHGSGAAMAVLPAGTGNLFALNLGIPHRLDEAVEVALTGRRHQVDVGVGDVAVNGVNSFLVMAGLGFDAAMLAGTDPAFKRKHGSLAYVRSGLNELRYPQDRYRLTIDGADQGERRASCVLLANVGHVRKDLAVVHGARPDDGHLDVTVIRARSLGDWVQVAARITLRRRWGDVRVETFRAQRIELSSDGGHPLEYDGEVGAEPVTSVAVQVAPSALTVCVP